ncbi:Uncharacterized protein GBIM_06974 [Gryllus bimaculatus]|nr:Uncharacterized protein GBIM_06974 [Gryllus bimaculatus]
MPKDLDVILEDVGQFGKYQIITYFIISLPMVFAIVSSHSFVFTSGDMTYRCQVPECEGNITEASEENFIPSWLHRAVPFEEKAVGLMPSQCYRYTPTTNDSVISDNCPTQAFSNYTKERCENWVFKGEESSIAREWSLTCDDNKMSVAFVFAGMNLEFLPQWALVTNI